MPTDPCHRCGELVPKGNVSSTPPHVGEPWCGCEWPRVMGIDPSLTATGYAVLDGPGALVEAGIITPTPQRGDVLRRCKSIESQVRAAWCDAKGPQAVIEMPGKRPPRGLRMQARVGQANYGVLCGFLFRALRPDILTPIPADEWTTISKARRVTQVAALFPQYREQMGKDKGGDVADAIALALWWYEQQAKGHPDETA